MTMPTWETFDSRKRSENACPLAHARVRSVSTGGVCQIGGEVLRGRAVDRRGGPRAQLLQEAGHELVVAERVLDAGLVQRPRAGVELGHLGLRLGVAGLEQRAARSGCR